jgi:hypothetical protein
MNMRSLIVIKNLFLCLREGALLFRSVSPCIVFAIVTWELAQIRQTRKYSEGSFFWRERKRWRYEWRQNETRASLCSGPCFEKALAAFFERRMPEWASRAIVATSSV